MGQQVKAPMATPGILFNSWDPNNRKKEKAHADCPLIYTHTHPTMPSPNTKKCFFFKRKYKGLINNKNPNKHQP